MRSNMVHKQQSAIRARELLNHLFPNETAEILSRTHSNTLQNTSQGMMSALETIPQMCFQPDAQHKHKRMKNQKCHSTWLRVRFPDLSQHQQLVSNPHAHHHPEQANGSISEHNQDASSSFIRGYGQGFLGLRTFSTFKKLEGTSHPTCHRDTSVTSKRDSSASCTCLPLSTSAMILHCH